jgi:hypothetical protein
MSLKAKVPAKSAVNRQKVLAESTALDIFAA